ncbi:hypothetical protein AAG570_000622 [Ranatra chinensis]|uniref:Sulfotransferase domain-containing protein n=1 Tax=Ranatra chinensis TaxID=642074 RepID=A0ABD0ZAA3_9HEMI
MLETFRGEKTGWYQVGPKKYFLPSKYAQEADHFLSFKTRSDDIWICTFPRSGTTLTQEMIWLIANNFDFERAKSIPLAERFPFFEFNISLHDKAIEMINENLDLKKQEMLRHITQPAYKILKDAPSPRFIKTHFPPSLLPRDIWQTGAKIIYVARNPKDVAASYYHLCRLWRTIGYEGGFDQFWDHFKSGLVTWGPFWPHVKEGWECRSNPNVLFLFCEDIINDMPHSIQRIANFLGCNASKDQIKALQNHLDINNFKKNPAVNFECLKELKLLLENEQPFIRIGMYSIYFHTDTIYIISSN